MSIVCGLLVQAGFPEMVSVEVITPAHKALKERVG